MTRDVTSTRTDILLTTQAKEKGEKLRKEGQKKQGYKEISLEKGTTKQRGTGK
jgi:hypothetical protein